MIIKVIVRPDSRENAVLKEENGVLHIAIAAPAEKNKANKELLKFLSRYFKKSAKLVKGVTSRIKLVELA